MELSTAKRHESDFIKSLTAAQIEACVHRILGDGVTVLTATEITMGLFNTTFRVELADGRRCALRVGPGEAPEVFSNERHLMRREHSLTPHLAVIAPLLPHVLGSDFTGTVLSRDFVLMDWMAGDNWDEVKGTLSAEENDTLWRELGTLVKQIHATVGTHFGPPSPEPPCRTWSAVQVRCARGLEDDAVRFGQEVARFTRFRRCVELAAPVLDEITVPHLLHGDPWQKNVLIRKDASGVRIVGLLDHDRGLWGDPWAEWVFQNKYFKSTLWESSAMEDFAPAFWETYGPRPTDESSLLRAKIYHGLLCAQIILEAWRYHWDGRLFMQMLDRVCGELETQLGTASVEVANH
ncbi:MAG: phosphotransferase [Verrucomicrobiota bacterium]|nr:phosphotransferase [Verrucomicrobiota bacterium]